jgi:hypothetical protein
MTPAPKVDNREAVSLMAAFSIPLARGPHASFFLLIFFASTVALGQSRILLSDEYLWTGEEGTRVVRISGKFQSEEAMTETLNLTARIGRFSDRVWPHEERDWRLKDVLLSMDLNGNGNVASWIVAGPTPLITDYVDTLAARLADRTIFYDFNVQDRDWYFPAD